jgi:hypothetical protein
MIDSVFCIYVFSFILHRNPTIPYHTSQHPTRPDLNNHTEHNPTAPNRAEPDRNNLAAHYPAALHWTAP